VIEARFRSSTRRGSRASLRALTLAATAVAGFAPTTARGSSYVEVTGCRPAKEEGEFLQICVKVASGRKAGKLLGPGRVAPGGAAAAVIHHRRYGSPADRVSVLVYGPEGRAETYPMGEPGGDEFALQWAPGSSRYLGWVEVDGRGGLLKVVDRRRKRFLLSLLTPLEEWPVFAPRGARALLPVGAAGENPLEAQVRELQIIDLPSRTRQTVLRAAAGEELVAPRWISPTVVQATLRKIGVLKGKLVSGKLKAPPPPPATRATEE
jgi:hypothetical protein